jgi:hypothetical protein
VSFPEGAPPPGPIREKAHEILSRPEFARSETLLERVAGWLGDLFSWLSFGVGGGSGVLGNVVGLGIVVAIVYVLVLLVRSLLGRPRRTKTGTDDALALEVEAGRDAADWRSEAERLEAAGQWREAMRARYRELIRALIEDRVLDDIPGRTTGEYRAAFATARPGEAGAFGDLTDLFESVWYGGQDTGPDDNRRFRALAARVKEGSSAAVPV